MHFALIIVILIFSQIVCEPATIRILFDTRYIANDVDQRSCYKAGDSYQRGNPPNTGTLCSALRLYDCWDTCSSTDVLSPEVQSFISERILTSAKSRIESFLKVKNPTNATFKATISKCLGYDEGVPVPTDYINDGIAFVDLVVFVTARPMAPSFGLTASGECQADVIGRPLFAHLNIDPKIIGQPESIQNATVLREMIRVLGFNQNKFNSYRDEDGNLREKVVTIIPKTHLGDTVNVKALNLPTVIQNVRDHFNCRTVPFVELEDAVGYEDYLEQRLFMNEIMTASFSINVGDGPVLSNISMAVLHDSGFYIADFTKADEYIWGRGIGCKIFDKRCENWNANRNGENREGYFCSSINDATRHCTFDLMSKATCELVSYATPLRKYYQHFTDEYLGGTNEFMDYCPYETKIPAGDCRRETNAHDQIEKTGEKYSEFSRCFITNAYAKNEDSPTGTKLVSRCFEHACENGTNLYVRIGKNWIKCDPGKEITSIPSFSGKLLCPPIESLCPNGRTTANMNPDVSDPDKNRDPDGWWSWIYKVPIAVWISICVVIGLIILGILLFIAYKIFRKLKGRGEWDTHKTVDLTRPDADFEH